MRTPFRIGFAGFARSGKDSAANFLHKKILADFPGRKLLRTAFANKLKVDVAEISHNSFNINVFDCSDEEKDIIRPLLVGHGMSKRRANHRHWIEEVEKDERTFGAKISIISDVRFFEHANDEVPWVREKGLLFYVTKKGIFAANEDEQRNNPKIIDAADETIYNYGELDALEETMETLYNKYLKDIYGAITN
jgi:hypothetical protein